jgi:hypothetical protein
VSSRALRILGRFPAHLGATRAGTQLQAVTEALAAQIEVFSADLAAVRRSHRIGDAEALVDVLKLGALHGIGPADLDMATLRRDTALKLVAALEAAGAPDARDAAAAALLDLWGIDEPDGATPRLALFAPARAPAAPPDLDAAAAALALKLRGELRARRQVDAVRARIVRIAQLHAGGNGSVATMLDAAANALDQDLDPARNAAVKAQLVALGRAGTLELSVADDLFHSQDLFWHSSYVRDRAPLVRLVPALAPDKLVRMNDRIVVSELADQMLLRFEQLAPTLQQLGLGDLQASSSLDQDTATLVAGKLGFAVERYPRAVAGIGAHTTVARFAVLVGQTGVALLAHLAELGVAGLTPDSELSPDDAARAARRYGYVVRQTLPSVPEILGMEENPMRREDDRKEECEHGRLFSVIRKGFGRETLQARVTGRGNHTYGPMIVNRDEGRGAGWFGAVADGQTLVFEEDGRVLLEGDDVTDRAFSWTGACFADAARPSTRDFVFGGPGADPIRAALFAVAAPAGSMDREFVFPHAGENIVMPGVGIGETRMAFFVQQAHFGSRDNPAGDAPPLHRLRRRVRLRARPGGRAAGGRHAPGLRLPRPGGRRRGALLAGARGLRPARHHPEAVRAPRRSRRRWKRCRRARPGGHGPRGGGAGAVPAGGRADPR